jgi:hypothetical protein
MTDLIGQSFYNIYIGEDIHFLVTGVDHEKRSLVYTLSQSPGQEGYPHTFSYDDFVQGVKRGVLLPVDGTECGAKQVLLRRLARVQGAVEILRRGVTEDLDEDQITERAHTLAYEMDQLDPEMGEYFDTRV